MFPRLAPLLMPCAAAAVVASAAAGLVLHPQSSGATARLRGLSAVSSRVAWASGGDGTILRSTDGGATWRARPIPDTATLDFRDIDAVSENVACALSIGPGEASRIYRTADGGAHWQLQFANRDPKIFLDAMAFKGERGFAIGDAVDGVFVILRTDDGGRTWVRVASERLPPALPGEGAFAASGTNVAMRGDRVWIATGAGRVLRSTDGGGSWTIAQTPLPAGPSAGIFSIAFRDDRHGVIVGGDYRREQAADANVATTSDGGVTWTLASRGVGGYRSAVAFVTGTRASFVATGPSGTDLSEDDGRSWRPALAAGFDTLSFAPGGRVGWAAGSGGRIARFDARPKGTVAAKTLRQVLPDEVGSRKKGLSSNMRRLLLLPIAAGLILAGACGGATAPPASAPNDGGAGSITGRERVGWEQAASDAAVLATYRFAIYVDGARSELSTVQCDAAQPQVFSCTGKGPDLAPGSHTLEISAFNESGESPRSAPLTITVGRAAQDTSEWPAAEPDPAADAGLTLDKLTDGLVDPVDAAFLPDGRLLIAESGGRVRLFERGELRSPDALTAEDDGGDAADRILSLTIDPSFEKTRYVFILMAAQGSRGDVFRLARYRELNGVLAQRAVLLEVESPPVTEATAILRATPDGKLLLAAGAPCCSGMLLRLNADGTTPRDQAGSSPVIAALQSPDGLAVDARGWLWVAEEQAGVARLTGLALEGRPLRAVVRARYALSSGGAIAIHSSRGMASFRNTLLLASPQGRRLQRIRFAAAGAGRIEAVDTLLQDAVGEVRVVVEGPDGTVYFCTRDALGRLSEP